jgi:allantoinase
MSVDCYLFNGLIVTEAGAYFGGLSIEGGKIVGIFPGSPMIPAKKTVNLHGKAVMPGLVDSHVHLNEPGRTEWEGFTSGSMAAAAGGITTVLDMPLNNIPYTTNRQAMLAKRSAVADKSVVDYGLWGGLVDNNLDDLDGLRDEGAIAFKAFMSESGVDFKYVQDDVLYYGLQWMQKTGSLLGVHAINEPVSRYRRAKLIEAGRKDRRAWGEAFPPEGELEAILRAIYWARVTGGRLHVVHVSIASGLHAITEARRQGVQVTGETCPHYLCLNLDDFERIGPAAKCAPPIRSQAEVDALWQCLLDGEVELIASDHSPSTWAEKEGGLENIWQAWGGISGLQTMLPLMLTAGCHQRGVPLATLARLMCANPARLYGLYPRKGAIAPGSDADLVIIDLHQAWTLVEEDLLYHNRISPFIGRTFQGKIVQTLVRGETVYEDGKIKVQPGFGRFLRPLAAPVKSEARD